MFIRASGKTGFGAGWVWMAPFSNAHFFSVMHGAGGFASTVFCQSVRGPQNGLMSFAQAYFRFAVGSFESDPFERTNDLPPSGVLPFAARRAFSQVTFGPRIAWAI